jgi:Bystin
VHFSKEYYFRCYKCVGPYNKSDLGIADAVAIQGGCTLKEAAIVASVLSKVSVPVLHSAAALARLAGLPNYSGIILFT